MNSPASSLPYDLSFEPEGHVYKVAGKQKISTTTLLKRNGLYDNITYATDEHLWRGKAIHEAMHYFHKGTLDFARLDPLINGYIRGYRKFEVETGFRALGWERPLWHPVLDYVGTPDLWGMVKDEYWVVDYKHGVVPRVTGLQLSSYKMLLQASGLIPKDAVVRRVGLQLLAEGDYRPRYFKDENDDRIWLMIVSVHNWGQNNV